MALKTRTAHLSFPEKQWVSRISLVLMAVLGLMLLVMSKTHNPWVAKLRSGITDVVAPVMEVLARPIDALHSAEMWVQDMVQLREENISLKNQNIQLLQWQMMAREMETENNALRSLLHVVPAQKKNFITVRFISDVGGPYMRSALIGGGSDNNIKKDEAVINENGLVGRVIETGHSSARVLLLSDINSRVPVVAEHAREKSILVGNNSDLPTLSYLSADSKIRIGERIITSGDGGVFPEGIPVGIVTSIDNGKIRIQPFVDMSAVEYVSVIDYTLQ